MRRADGVERFAERDDGVALKVEQLAVRLAHAVLHRSQPSLVHDTILASSQRWIPGRRAPCDKEEDKIARHATAEYLAVAQAAFSGVGGDAGIVAVVKVAGVVAVAGVPGTAGGVCPG